MDNRNVEFERAKKVARMLSGYLRQQNVPVSDGVRGMAILLGVMAGKAGTTDEERLLLVDDLIATIHKAAEDTGSFMDKGPLQ